MNNEISNPLWLNSNSADSNEDNFAFSLTREPLQTASILASNNALQYEFTPISNTNTPIKSKLVLQINGNIPENEIISFNYLNSSEKVTFIAKLIPLKPKEFTTSSTFGGVTYRQQVANDIYSMLLKINSIYNNYNITLMGNIITIEAKQAANDSFNFANIIVPSAVSYTLNNGVAEYNIDNFYNSHLLVKFHYNSMDDVATNGLVDKTKSIVIGGFKGKYGYNGKPIVINCESSGKDIVSFDKPSLKYKRTSGFNIQECKNTMKPFYITYNYGYRNSPTSIDKNVALGISTVKYIHLAAFDRLSPYSLTDYVWNDGGFTPKFLTEFQQKTTHRNQHEYLQIIRFKSNQDNSFGLNVEYTLNDNTVGSYDIPSPTTFGSLSGDIRFNVSFEKIGLPAIELTTQKQVISYKVKLYWINSINGLTYYSKPVTYSLSSHCNSRNYNIIWCNKLGAVDSLMFNSDMNIDIDREIKSFDRFIDGFENTENIINYSANYTNVKSDTLYSLHSGLMNQDEYLKLHSLLTSPMVMMYDEDNDEYRQIIIKESNWSSENDRNLYNLTITFTTTSLNKSINNNNLQYNE